MATVAPFRPPTAARRAGVVLLYAAMVALTAFSAVVSLGLGSEPLRPSGVVDVLQSRLLQGRPGDDPVYDAIVWELRAPRVLMSMVVGAGLAIAGATMQTLVRNPLADPYLLGVSAGAGVGATLVIALGVLGGLGVWALSVGALLGALAASVLVFGISIAQGGLTPLRLVLTGVVMSSAFSSVSSFLVFLSDEPRATQSVLFWLLGSLAGSTWAQLVPPVVAVLVATVVVLGLHGWLDALATGDDTASAVGVPVRALRVTLFVLSAVLVGVLVAVSGGIGFVGLVVPHLARLVVGTGHRAVLPLAALAGALFLLWVDVVARTAVSPQEVPLSVVTGIVGAPIFLVLLGRRQYRFGGES
ncbi:FecCD family ABC transporter permease [Solicola sp. PLA-1-18]|uniref:FecCD family ABC transporter permease n=1 Tax=Solicola sp. PLA-1-18 TaxID=3380532 RepID=UPI003B80FD27